MKIQVEDSVFFSFQFQLSVSFSVAVAVALAVALAVAAQIPNGRMILYERNVVQYNMAHSQTCTMHSCKFDVAS